MSTGTDPRDTSLLAFEQIRKEGILGAVQWRVYELLFHQGPLTAREVTWHFESKGSTAITTYQPRLRELEELGVVRRPYKRDDQITGRLAYVWDVTSHVPTAAERARLLKGPRKTVPFLADKERLARLKAECEQLFNERVMSDDFYELVVFLENQVA